MMDFDIVGSIRQVEVIAAGVIVENVEVHWYEAHGIGKKEFKVKDPE